MSAQMCRHGLNEACQLLLIAVNASSLLSSLLCNFFEMFGDQETSAAAA